jgi:hypothetical protein
VKGISRKVTLSVTAGLAAAAIVGVLGGSAGAASKRSSSHASASIVERINGSGPLIAFSELGAACGNFCVQVQNSIMSSFKAAGLSNFLVLNNNLDANTTIANAKTVAARHPALYIDTDGGLTNYKVTEQLMAKEHIPLILLFGAPPTGNPPNVAWENASHAQSGVIAGNFIVNWVKQHWGGQIDGLFATWLASWPPENKLAIENMVPIVSAGLVKQWTMSHGITLFDGQGQATPLEAAVTAFLNAHPNQHHLVFDTATSDTDAASVETALQQAGRVKDAMIVSAGASSEGINLLCNAKSTAMQGDINYQPGTWGPGLLKEAQLMLAKKPFPPIVEPHIFMVTPANVAKYFKC